MDVNYNNGIIDLLWLAQILIIIAFFALLIMAIFLLSEFYIADNKKCKSYNDASLKGKLGTKEHTVALTNSLFNDGVWPVAYIAASISTGFIILGLALPATVQNIMIIFLFSFIPYYAILLFVIHHYAQFIKNDIVAYIENVDNNENKNINTDDAKSIDDNNVKNVENVENVENVISDDVRVI
jgi:hypothetical protein